MASISYTRGGKEWTPRFIESIDINKCIGCGRCYKVCSRDVLELIENPLRVRTNTATTWVIKSCQLPMRTTASAVRPARGLAQNGANRISS